MASHPDSSGVDAAAPNAAAPKAAALYYATESTRRLYDFAYLQDPELRATGAILRWRIRRAILAVGLECGSPSSNSLNEITGCFMQAINPFNEITGCFLQANQAIFKIVRKCKDTPEFLDLLKRYFAFTQHLKAFFFGLEHCCKPTADSFSAVQHLVEAKHGKPLKDLEQYTAVGCFNPKQLLPEMTLKELKHFKIDGCFHIADLLPEIDALFQLQLKMLEQFMMLDKKPKFFKCLGKESLMIFVVILAYFLYLFWVTRFILD